MLLILKFSYLKEKIVIFDVYFCVHGNIYGVNFPPRLAMQLS